MATIVTSDQFITGILCDLALRGRKSLRLTDTTLDRKFSEAFAELVARLDVLDVQPDFSLRTNPYHGDSETLRETLYQVRERGVVALNNPSFKTVEFKLEDEEAIDYLDNSPIPRDFFDEIVEKFFLDGEQRAA